MSKRKISSTEKLFIINNKSKHQQITNLQRIEFSSKEILIQKKLGDKKIIIFADKTGKIKGHILDRNKQYKVASDIRGLPSHIKIHGTLEFLLLRQFLEDNFYITRRFDDIVVNPRLFGGGKGDGKFFGFAFGATQIAAGVGLTIGTGGLGAVAGAALIGSGVQGAVYAATTEEEDMNAEEYFKQSLVGGTTGLVTGGVGGVASCCGTIGKVVGPVISGIGGKTTSTVVNAAVHDQDIGEAFEESLQPKNLATGALSGTISGLSGAVGSKVTQKVISETESKVTGAVVGGVCGGASGAASSAGSTIVANAIEGKDDLTEGVGQAAVTGTTVGTVIGAAQGVAKVVHHCFCKFSLDLIWT